MASLILESVELNSPTPRLVIEYREKARSKKPTFTLYISANGLSLGEKQKMLEWKQVKQLEHRLRIGKARKERRKVNVKAINVVLGGRLKDDETKITYVTALRYISKGAQKGYSPVMTFGITNRTVRLGRRNADVDAAKKVMSWRQFISAIESYLEKI